MKRISSISGINRHCLLFFRKQERCGALRDTVRQKLQHEIRQIDQLMESFKPLLDVVTVREPDLIELSALATVLHSFYGGIENIFTTIGKNVDSRVPTGTKWHKGGCGRFLGLISCRQTESRTVLDGTQSAK